MLHHRLDGPSNGPLLILGPSLGTTLDLWQPQLEELTRSWRVLRYDLPGHGGSPAWPGVTLDDLAAEVLRLADGQGAARFGYAGVSVGGAVGTTLAALAPERVGALVLCCSAARFGEPAGWLERAAKVRREGMGPLAGTAPSRWFTPDFTGFEPYVAMMRGCDPEGYAAMCEAIAAFDARDRLGKITAPTLVISGAKDPATPPADGQVLASGIPDARLIVVEAASHLASVERAEAVTRAIAGHVRHSAAMKVRREVLGDAHVDRAVARTTDFTADFQDLITRYAWGEIWTRPGLDRKTRSCITLTALVAQGQLEELAMHVRAALRNGLTPDEIKEVLLQTAIYCGVPAANAAFAVAQRVLAEP